MPPTSRILWHNLISTEAQRTQAPTHLNLHNSTLKAPLNSTPLDLHNSTLKDPLNNEWI
jgi:hypothetical protein